MPQLGRNAESLANARLSLSDFDPLVDRNEDHLLLRADRINIANPSFGNLATGTSKQTRTLQAALSNFSAIWCSDVLTNLVVAIALLLRCTL